jgi:hypothetical protein
VTIVACSTCRPDRADASACTPQPFAFAGLLLKDGVAPDMDDEILKAALLTQGAGSTRRCGVIRAHSTWSAGHHDRG